MREEREEAHTQRERWKRVERERGKREREREREEERDRAQSGYRATETVERKGLSRKGNTQQWRERDGNNSPYALRKERCNYSLSTSFKSTFFNAAKPTSEAKGGGANL